jgi:hypothetical protein
MKSGLLALIGAAPKPEKEKPSDGYADQKVTAAEDALQAVKDEDAEAFADAVEAIFRVCRLERTSESESEDAESEDGED